MCLKTTDKGEPLTAVRGDARIASEKTSIQMAADSSLKQQGLRGKGTAVSKS